MHTAHAPASLGPGAAVLTGLAALAIVILLWGAIQHLDTMGHEGGHALVAAILGFSVLGIVLERNSDGLTSYLGRRGLGVVLVGVAGYLGSSLFGLAAAELITLGYPVAVLWLAVLLLALLLFVLARSFGYISVPAAIGLLMVILHYADTRTEVILAYGLTWLLLLSGVRVAFAHNVSGGDAHSLRERTYLPRILWAVIWMGGTIAALIYGGDLLVLGR